MRSPTPNENGVYAKEDAATIEYRGKKADAAIHVLELPEGWIAAASFGHQCGSHHSHTSPLTAHVTFTSREAAVREEAAFIAASQQRILTEHSSVVTDAQREEAANILRWATSIAQFGNGPATQAVLF